MYVHIIVHNCSTQYSTRTYSADKSSLFGCCLQDRRGLQHWNKRSVEFHLHCM